MCFRQQEQQHMHSYPGSNRVHPNDEQFQQPSSEIQQRVAGDKIHKCFLSEEKQCGDTRGLQGQSGGFYQQWDNEDDAPGEE